MGYTEPNDRTWDSAVEIDTESGSPYPLPVRFLASDRCHLEKGWVTSGQSLDSLFRTRRLSKLAPTVVGAAAGFRYLTLCCPVETQGNEDDSQGIVG